MLEDLSQAIVVLEKLLGQYDRNGKIAEMLRLLDIYPSFLYLIVCV